MNKVEINNPVKYNLLNFLAVIYKLQSLKNFEKIRFNSMLIY